MGKSLVSCFLRHSVQRRTDAVRYLSVDDAGVDVEVVKGERAQSVGVVEALTTAAVVTQPAVRVDRRLIGV